MADTVPAVPMVFGGIELVEPTHFDGWSVDDITDLLVTNAAQLDRREQETDAWRIGMGLGLWCLRQEVGESSFSGRLRSIADKAGVTVRTLNRWQAAAVAHHHLPPTRRSVGQSKTRKIGLGTTSVPKAITAESTEVPPLAPIPDPPKPTPSPNHPTTQPGSGMAAQPARPCVRCKGTGEEPRLAAVPSGGCQHPKDKKVGRACEACGDKRAWAE